MKKWPSLIWPPFNNEKVALSYKATPSTMKKWPLEGVAL
jgi:hypothetical protein